MAARKRNALLNIQQPQGETAASAGSPPPGQAECTAAKPDLARRL
jgi:hypothetical protein